MNAFGLMVPLDEKHPECQWTCYVLAWLRSDLLGEEALEVDLAAGFRAVRELDDLYWREYWRPWIQHMHAQSIDGAMQDLIAVSLARLQSLVGSLGPELDEQIYQWLHKAS